MTATTDFHTARHNMVEYQIRCCKILDAGVLDLIESMPREEFVPADVRSLAYMEGRVPLPCNQEMMSPLQEASILQNLMLDGSERVLEIGTGTGFLTTMLAMQAAEVVSCEIHPELAEAATANIANHGVTNASVVTLNAMDSDAVAAAPQLQGHFDVIIIGAAIDTIPSHIESLLADGGQLIAFIGSNPVVSLMHRRRIGQSWQENGIFETLLLDIEGRPEKREFVF